MAGKARRIEELGYSALFITDHLDDQLAPVPALMRAADATRRLQIGTMVLNNDFRHPLVLAKELATLDVLSGGRTVIGLGAGWQRSDYEESGIAYDSPGTRIARMAEALTIIKGHFTDGPFSFSGRYYSITDHDGTPKPMQKPHPPILVGGGGTKVLTIAAREADIVSVNYSLPEGELNPRAASTGSAAATHDKIALIRNAAGKRFPGLELSVTASVCVLTNDRRGTAERIAPSFGLHGGEVLASPYALIGTVEQIVDDLQQRREEFGLSHIVFPRDHFDMMAPVVNRLAGS